MAFRNQPLAGNTLVRAAIQSTPFVHGSVGWSINRDGSAEFNNVAIRGATTSQGVSLYYNGTPALNTMIASIAPAAGTDIYGNNYPQGIATYNGAGVKTGSWNLGSLVTTDPVSLGFAEITPQNTTLYSPLLQFLAGGNSSYRLGSLGAATDTVHANQPFEVLQLAGASSVTDPNHSYALVEIRGGGTTTDGAVGTLGWANNSFGYIPFFWNQTGITGVGFLYAATPGTSPAAAESWHTTPLSTNWAATGEPCRYRLMPDGTVVLTGWAIKSVTTVASGDYVVPIGGLPVGYRPLHRSYFVANVDSATSRVLQLQANLDGSVQVFFTGAALTGPLVVFDGIRFPTI